MTAKAIERLFSEITSNIAWGVGRTHGSFIVFNFGLPHLQIHEKIQNGSVMRRYAHVTGEWHLWVYCARWDIRSGADTLARNDDDTGHIDEVAASLNGQKLERVSYDPAAKCFSLHFDLGHSFHIFPDDELRSDQWMLFKKDEHIATLTHAGTISFEG